MISLVTTVIVLIITFTIISLNKKRTIDNLISQLENAINKHDINMIIDLYPNYCKDDVANYFSQEKLNEFYNNEILQNNEDMKIHILFISNFDQSSCDNVTKQITDDYQKNILIEDYQVVQIKYQENFGESNLQVIRIDGSYYLYFYGNIGEPLSYFH